MDFFSWTRLGQVVEWLLTVDGGSTSKFVRSVEGKKTAKRVWDELNAKLEEIQSGILGHI